jgi:uncharacterized protein (DUF1501 family)
MNVYRSLCIVAALLAWLGPVSLAHARSPTLSNLSTRAQIGTSGNILIAGLTIGPGGPKTALLRAAGPTIDRMPTLTVSGPDDTGQGRWIPTTSVDEYAATLAIWFGVSSTDLPVVLPNIGRFAKPNPGFLA